MNDKYVLVLDHDGIIHPNELLEEYIKKIDYRATIEYRDSLMQLMEERELTKEQFDLLMMEHYFIKDQVLEEVKEEYRGRIPYDMIYTIDKAYKDVVKTIEFVYNSGVFDLCLLNSHRNCEFEKNSKDFFYKLYLPFVKTYYPFFHQEKFDSDLKNLYENNDRVRTNKAMFLMQELKIGNLKGFYAVDDCLPICKEYETCGAKAFWKKPGDSSIDVIMRAAREAFDDKKASEERVRGAYRKIR